MTTILDVTHGPGLMPIQLGPARLQKSHHTLVHYFDLTLIRTEIDKLNRYFQTALENSKKNAIYTSELANYDKLITHTSKLVQQKLNNIYPNFNTRSKRGLIDGLGSAIKFLTGNMDASDATRINKIIKHLENNQQDLEKQLLNQYSINKHVLQHFNYSVSNIQYNEQLLKNKIIKINNNNSNNTVK